jgi:prepilin-type N-terminal cleavage/methylation domain-containing protein
MGLEFPNSNRAFTLIEVAIVVGIIGILYAVSLWAIQPDLVKKAARDAVRITDIGRLQSAIENYISDNGVPPDVSGILRQSDVPASPSASPALSNGYGWVGQDLQAYLEKLPLDPLNTGSSVYRYKRMGKDYELDAQLENNPNKMSNSDKDGDGGNSNVRFERGTDLTILGD